MIKYLLQCLLLLMPLLLCLACSDENKEKEAIIQAKIEKTRSVLANKCTDDSQCMITGCRGGMCRAMPEPDFCDNRIVVSIENEEDIAAVKRIVAQQLTVSEGDTLRIGGYAAGKWTVSFQAAKIQRKRVEQALEFLPQSGFARLHPNAAKYTEALFGELSKISSDVALKSMKGVGNLAEMKIRSGDILSKEDISSAWERVSPALAVPISEDDDIERLWAYDVIMSNIAQLRLWPIDKRQRISAQQWKNLDVRTESGDIILTGQLEGKFADTLQKWTDSGQLIAVLLGTQVIASALPLTSIDDGRFELIIRGSADSEIMRDSIETLQLVANLRGGVFLDRNATAKVERDIACQEQHPRQCACIDGFCGWKSNAEYNKCLFN